MTIIVGQIVDSLTGAALPNANVTTPTGVVSCDLGGAFSYDALLGTPLTGNYVQHVSRTHTVTADELRAQSLTIALDRVVIPQLPAPTISVTHVTATSISIEVVASFDCFRFNVMWGPEGGVFSQTEVAANGNRAPSGAEGLQSEHSYHFKAQGEQNGFNPHWSAWSSETIVKTLAGPAPVPPDLSPVTNVVAIAENATTVRVTWDNPKEADFIYVSRELWPQNLPRGLNDYGTWWQLPSGTTELVEIPEDPSVRTQIKPRSSYIYTIVNFTEGGVQQSTAVESNVVTTPAKPLAPPRHSGLFIQSLFGHRGNFELVLPLGDHLGHYWRDNDSDYPSPGRPWHGPIAIPGPHVGPRGKATLDLPVQFLGASLVQSSLGPGNLDVVCVAKTAEGDAFLMFYERDSSGWHGPTKMIADGQLIGGVSGAPALIQGSYGKKGNYELIVPRGDHLAHYWRDNDALGYPWHGPITIPGPHVGPRGKTTFDRPVEFLAASLVQSSLGPGNLDVVCVAKTADGDPFLMFYGRDNSGWHGPTTLTADGQSIVGISGAPTLIQSTYGREGNYELIVPMGAHFGHYWRDNDSASYPWHGPIVIPGPFSGPIGKDKFALPVRFLSAALIQSNLRDGTLEFIAVAQTNPDQTFVLGYLRDASGWHMTKLVSDTQPVVGVTQEAFS
jgi:hypothetical protein